jgi:hypothetical protein
MRAAALPLAALLACASACIVEAPSATAQSAASGRGAAAQGGAREVPRLTLRGGANFGGRLELAGAEVAPGRVAPGQSTRVTLQFRVLEPPERDYLLFVHVEDADGRMQRFNLDHAPTAGPTSGWRKGQTVTDEFSLALPEDAEVRAVNLWFGFWHAETDERLALRNPEQVRNDGADRVLLTQLPVSY